MLNDSWFRCRYCGKKLIKRKPNGIFIFKFGKDNTNQPVVDMEISGSIKIKCLRKSCRKTNTISFFPNDDENQ